MGERLETGDAWTFGMDCETMGVGEHRICRSSLLPLYSTIKYKEQVTYEKYHPV